MRAASAGGPKENMRQARHVGGNSGGKEAGGDSKSRKSEPCLKNLLVALLGPAFNPKCCGGQLFLIVGITGIMGANTIGNTLHASIAVGTGASVLGAGYVYCMYKLSQQSQCWAAGVASFNLALAACITVVALSAAVSTPVLPALWLGVAALAISALIGLVYSCVNSGKKESDEGKKSTLEKRIKRFHKLHQVAYRNTRGAIVGQ